MSSSALPRGSCLLWWLVFLVVATCAGPGIFPARPVEAKCRILPTGGRNVWILASGRRDASPQGRQIIGAAYDGRVSAFDLEGALRWDFRSGAFIFDLATGDLDGDGRDEVLAASADGRLICLGPDGELRWQYDFHSPVYQVEVARLDGQSPVVAAGGVSREVVVFSPRGKPLRRAPTVGAVRLIRAGNFDGDDAEELFVLSLRGRPRGAVVFDGPRLEPVLSFDSDQFPPSWSHAPECAVGDLDGDGIDELLVAEGALKLSPHVARVVDFSPASLSRPSYDFFYRSPRYAVGDLTGDGRPEVVTLLGPDLTVHDARGRLLGQVRAPQGFTDLLYLPGEGGGSIVLGSSPNGDDNLYRFRLSGDWQADLAALAPSGRIAGIAQDAQRLAATIAGWHGRPAQGQPGPYPIQITSQWLDHPDRLGAVDWAIESIRAYQRDFPYPNLQFATVFWITENKRLMRPDGKPWIREHRLRYALDAPAIIDVARRMEAEKAHFWVQVGHGTAPYLSLETARAILQAAPTACLGLVSAEDEQAEHLAYYLEHYVCPLMDACRQHGDRMFILREKDCWWATMPALPAIRKLLFDGRYRSTLVPSVEDSNSRCPDTNLAGRVGLWLSGQVDRWGCRMVADCFSFNRGWEWEYPLVGHPHLRYLTAHTALGASVFMIKVGQDAGPSHYTRVGREGVAPFLRMLGKGILAPPKRRQFGGLSPLVLNVLNPSPRFQTSGANGHHFENFVAQRDLQPWAFGRLDCYWGMAPTPATDLSAYLWGRTRQFGNFIPPSPAGFVALVAGPLPEHGPVAWRTTWTTDGDRLTRDGRSYRPDDARAAILNDLAAGRRQFSCTVDGPVFWQWIGSAGDCHLLVLIDPGYLDPAPRDVSIAMRAAGAWTVRDRLDGVRLEPRDGRLAVTVPEGGLRILEFTPR